MLRVYSVALEMCRDAAVIAREIEKHDKDLANQLRRAAPSVALNIAEGSGAMGGNRRQRYHSAMGSAYEVGACYDCAEAMQYVERIAGEARSRQSHVLATLVKVLALGR